MKGRKIRGRRGVSRGLPRGNSRVVRGRMEEGDLGLPICVPVGARGGLQEVHGDRGGGESE